MSVADMATKARQFSADQPHDVSAKAVAQFNRFVFKRMTAIEAEGLFPRSTTWIGFRKDVVLRRYMLDFIRFFAPHIDAQQIDAAARAQEQKEIDFLFKDIKLPVRGGCSDDLSAAA